MALWKMPPRPMRSLKMRLIWRMVLFVFSESLLVTSYTWSTTSFISAPPRPGPPAAAAAAAAAAAVEVAAAAACGRAMGFGETGKRGRGSKRVGGRSLAVAALQERSCR
jgi:hypothetical protein